MRSKNAREGRNIVTGEETAITARRVVTFKYSGRLRELSVAKQDIGKIIGAKGRTIAAIRTLANAISGKVHKRIFIEVLE